MGGGDPGFDGFEHGFGVDADFVLGVFVGAEGQEVQEVVEVGLPIPLGVGVEREVHAGELAGEALAGGVGVGAVGVLVQHF